MKVYISTKKVQKGGRIALDEAALKNANLRIGDEVEIYFDTDTATIIVEKPKKTDAPAGRRAAASKGNE